MIATSLGVWMIATAILREAADQPLEGKRAVAQVIVARANEWHRPLHKVLIPSQFPWTKNKNFMPPIKNDLDRNAREEALEIARQAIKGAKAKRLQKGKYLFFNNTRPSGHKFKAEVPIVAIAAHYFY